MLVTSAETDVVSDFRRLTYHLHLYFVKYQWATGHAGVNRSKAKSKRCVLICFTSILAKACLSENQIIWYLLLPLFRRLICRFETYQMKSGIKELSNNVSHLTVDALGS